MSHSDGEDKQQIRELCALNDIHNLPAPDTKRWVIRRKIQVLAAVESGLISLEDACERYALSTEEFLSWQRLLDSHGARGLRATRVQDYRSRDRSTE